MSENNHNVVCTSARDVNREKLLQYLHKKNPMFVVHIQNLIKNNILEEKSYDPNNMQIVMCDSEMENALDVKSFHIDQLRNIIHKQLSLPIEVNRGENVNRVERIPHRRYQQRISPYRPHVLRAYKIFSDDMKVYLKPKFAELIKTVEGGIHAQKYIFTLKEVLALTQTYINERKFRLIDPRNEFIVNLTGDPLAGVFGVLALHRERQLHLLIRDQVIPIETEMED